MVRKSSLLLLAAAMLVLAACGPEVTTGGATAPTAEQIMEPTSVFKPAAQETEEGSRSVGELSVPSERTVASKAIADLAQRLGVAADDIEVVSVEEVVWPDASLGCPAPGMVYAQVLTDGMKVVLKAGDETYEYHGRTPDDLFLCGPEGPERSEPSSLGPFRGVAPDVQAEALVKTVTADMAQQLDIAASDVEVVSVEPVQWRNSGLGCEGPGKMTLQVITPGYKIVLAAGSDVFEYHTDMEGRYVLCQRSTR